jgi:hypothetical protein
LIGGVIGYIAVKDNDNEMAVRLLITGTVASALSIAIYMLYQWLLFGSLSQL